MKKLCRLLFYRFIALLLSCSMVSAEVFAMEQEMARHRVALRSVSMLSNGDTATDELDEHSATGLVAESDVDYTLASGTMQRKKEKQAYYSQAGSEGGDLYAIPMAISDSRVAGGASLPGQEGWDLTLYEGSGFQAEGWDEADYETGGEQKKMPPSQRGIFGQAPPFGQGRSVVGVEDYATADLLQPHRQDLIALERSRLRWALFDRVPPCTVYFLSTGKRVDPESFPLREENTLRRYHRVMGFFQETADAAVIGSYVAFAGLVVYQFVYGSPHSSVVKLLIGGNIRDLYNIADFPGHEAVGALLALPVIKGLVSSRSRARLTDDLRSSVRADLDFLKRALPTRYNDFWGTSIHNSLRNLTQRLLYDGRLTKTEALQILEAVYSFSKVHGGSSWMRAVGMFYAVANGPTRSNSRRLDNLNVRAQALRYLHLALKEAPHNSFRKFYIRYFLLGSLGDSDISKKERVFGALLRAGKLGAHLFILQGVVKAVIDLARPYQVFSSTVAPAANGSEINGSTHTANGTVTAATGAPTVDPTVNGTVTGATGAPTVDPTVNGTATAATGAPTVDPTVNGTVTAATGAPTVAPTFNGTVTAATGAPTVAPTVNGTLTAATGAPTVDPTVNGTATGITGTPTLHPTLPPVQDSLLQYRCLQQLVGNWNKFPEEDPRMDVLPRIGRLPLLPSQVDIDLSGKGLSGDGIVRFFRGLSEVQPKITVRSVNLSGNVVLVNQELQDVINALPLSLTVLKWDLDQYRFYPSPIGGFNFTALSRFENLTDLSLVSWNVGNFDSLSRVFYTLQRLQAINVTQTGLGMTPQITFFMQELFKLPDLERVGLGNNLIGLNGNDTFSLAQALNGTRALIRVLHLNNNDIGFKDAQGTLALFRSFARLSFMTDLSLEANVIGQQPSLAGESYALILGQALRSLSNIQRLNFRGNYISNSSRVDDLATLATDITQLPSLQYFYGARPAKDAPAFPAPFLEILRSALTHLNGTDIFALLLPSDVPPYFAALPSATATLEFPQKIGMTPAVLQAVADGIAGYSGTITRVDLSYVNSFAPSTGNPSTQFSPILAPVVGNLTGLQYLSIAGDQIDRESDQNDWFSAIGRLPGVRVLDLGGNFFARYGNITGLGVALNNTRSLSELLLYQSQFLSSAGTGPLDVLGSTFLSLSSLTRLDLNRDGIFGLGSGNGGSDLGLFFTRLKSASSLRRLDMSYNLVGDMNVTEGVIFASTLKDLPVLEFVDISYNRVNAKGSQGADAIADAVLYLLSNGTLQDFRLGGGFNISAPYRAAHQSALRNATDISSRDVCGPELFKIITGNSTIGGHRRSVGSFEERVLHDLEQPDHERDYDDAPSVDKTFRDYDEYPPLGEEFATSGASHVAPPRPLVFIASCLRDIMNFFRGSPPSINPTWERLQPSSQPVSVDDFSYVRSSNETESFVPAEGPVAPESLLGSVSNSTASVPLPAPSSLKEKDSAPGEKPTFLFPYSKAIPSSTDTNTTKSGSSQRTTLHFDSFNDYEARLREEVPTRSYLHHGESMVVSTLFVFAMLQQVFDPSDMPDRRDDFEVYMPQGKSFRSTFKNLERDLKAARQDALVMLHSGVERIYYPVTMDSADAYRQELEDIRSDERGVPTGRLKTLEKDLKRFGEDLSERACSEYEKFSEDRRRQFLLECALLNLSEATTSLRDQEVVSESRFKSLQRRLSEVHDRLTRLKQAPFESQGEMFEELREEMDWLAARLQEKIPLRQYNIRLPQYRDLKASYDERVREWKLEDESTLPRFFAEAFG